VTDAQIMGAVKTAANPMEAIGAAMMLDPVTFERTTKNGYPHPFAGYFVGRGGTLGDVPTDIVCAVFQVFAPEVVSAMWTQGKEVGGVKKGVELYFEQIHAWGRDHLSGFAGNERIVELGQKVIRGTSVNGLPLFAGWKSVPLPSDAPAAAQQTLMTLRELRGSVHNACVTAVGLQPIESHLLNKGVEYAQMFGWPEPFPEVKHLKGKREEAEEKTNARVAEIWAAALTPAEANELAELSVQAFAQATAKTGKTAPL
jgi:hypothetical protein